MVTGDVRSKVDRLWDAFWSGGISNPLEVIEQITYLLFIRRLDELHSRELSKSKRTREPVENPLFAEGQDHLRWSQLKQLDPGTMHQVMSQEVFPFLRSLGDNQSEAGASTYADHMRDARFTVPTAALLGRVVDMVDAIPMDNRDMTGDLYEYMLSKIASSGTNGQFRTCLLYTSPSPRD